MKISPYGILCSCTIMDRFYHIFRICQCDFYGATQIPTCSSTSAAAT